MSEKTTLQALIMEVNTGFFLILSLNVRGARLTHGILVLYLEQGASLRPDVRSHTGGQVGHKACRADPGVHPDAALEQLAESWDQRV